MEKLDKEKIEHIRLELNTFFDVQDIVTPKVGFIYTREDFDALLGRKTERWERAVSRGDGIYFIHSSKIEELTPHTNKDFWQVFTHEQTHWYYSEIAGSHNPKWFNEGLANIVAGAKRAKPTEMSEPVIEKYFNYSDEQNYSWGYWMVKYLLDEFGREKLVKLVKSLTDDKMTKDFFAKQFEKAYGFDVTELQDKTVEKYFPGGING